MLISRLPFVALFSQLVSIIAPEYFENGEPSLEAGKERSLHTPQNSDSLHYKCMKRNCNDPKTWTIRIFTGCEIWIENSVTRVTVRHHKACRVMPNSYPQWRNFQFEPNNFYRFFFLHTFLSTVAFRLEYVMFYQFNAKTTTFLRSRNVRFGSSF